MKTADLIPFLLIELNESDKYGFELTKNIETKSNGKIVIKQPTLYTLLKKLEKSKFITSYWQDSDIGGKRHYYKITDNGKLQLSTLPSYDVLMQNLLENEENDLTIEYDNNNQTDIGKNAFDEPLNEKHAESSIKEDPVLPSAPLETVLPTNEVFGQNSIDTSTETDLNKSNAEILKTDNSQEDFATNIVVAKFVEVKPISTPEIKPSTENKSNDIVDLDISIKTINNDVKFVDYVNLKKSKDYKKSKDFSKMTMLRAICVSMYIISLLVVFALLSNKFETTPLYYSSFIIGSIIAIFYPIITAIKIDAIKTKFKQKSYKFNMKISIISKMSLISFILLLVLIFNIAMQNNSFEKIFTINNFNNFYAPILLSTSLILDSFLAKILLLKSNK